MWHADDTGHDGRGALNRSAEPGGGAADENPSGPSQAKTLPR
jgi:hypothetical protein